MNSPSTKLHEQRKGDCPRLPKRPEGCSAQTGTVPFSPTIRRVAMNSPSTKLHEQRKGDCPRLPERPEGCSAQTGTVPFSRKGGRP